MSKRVFKKTYESGNAYSIEISGPDSLNLSKIFTEIVGRINDREASFPPLEQREKTREKGCGCSGS